MKKPSAIFPVWSYFAKFFGRGRTVQSAVGRPTVHLRVEPLEDRLAPAALLISEFRFRGPAGVNDEFIELYNNTDSPLTVNAVDGSSGFAVAAADGVVRVVIPNGTIIPARGHYLGANNGTGCRSLWGPWRSHGPDT